MKNLLVIFIAWHSIFSLAMENPKSPVWRSPRVVERKKIEENREELSPLQKALIRFPCDPEEIKILLKNKADPNCGLQHKFGGTEEQPINFYPGWTGCHIGVRMDVCPEVLQLLHEHGGNFLAEDNGGWTPIKLARRKNCPNAKKFLRNLGLLKKIEEPKENILSQESELSDSNIQGNAYEDDSFNFLRENQSFAENVMAVQQLGEPIFCSCTTFVMILAVLYYGFYCSL